MILNNLDNTTIKTNTTSPPPQNKLLSYFTLFLTPNTYNKIFIAILASLMLINCNIFAATFNVTSSGDANTSGTLRYAINQANLNSGSTININPGLTINVTSANGPLPAIIKPTTINGNGATIDGSFLNVPGEIIGLHFDTGSDGSEVNDLTVTTFSSQDVTSGNASNVYGIRVDSTNVKLDGITIGNITGGKGNIFFSSGFAYGMLINGDSNQLDSITISGDITGGSINGDAYGMRINGNSNQLDSITISGAITGGGNSGYAYGMLINGDSNQLDSITISGAITGGSSNGFAYGMYITGDSNQLNSITISGVIIGADWAYGMYINGNLNQLDTITISGTIKAGGNRAYGMTILGDSNSGLY